MHLLLLKYHVMAGVDCHDELTATLPPVPAPEIPHIVGMVMCGVAGLAGWGGGATMTGDDVKADSMNIICRGSDISYLIPHVPIPPYPPCAMLVLIIPTSGSKSYFGAASVLTAKGPVACCLLVTMNPQLNCDDPLSLPSGMAASWSTVVCGMSFGDILGGILAMGLDMLISLGLNKLGSKLAKGVFGKVMDKMAPGWAKALESTVNAIMQQITGSPVGYTYSVPGHALGDAANAGDIGSMIGFGIGDAVGGPQGRTVEQQLLGAQSPVTQSQLAQPPPAYNPASSMQGITHDPGVEAH